MKSLALLNFLRLILKLSIGFSLVAVPTSFAQSNEQEGAPRWFEIEVILYKLDDDSGLTKESWATDILIKNEQPKIDFLQPFSMIEDNAPLKSESVNENELESSQLLQTSIPASLNENNIVETSVEDPQLEILPKIELPFVLLDKEFLQLTNEAKSISANPRYNLLAHFAWRQPVGDKNEAIDVRIAGGFDYHENYEYSGEKKVEDLQTYANLETESKFSSALNDQLPLLELNETKQPLTELDHAVETAEEPVDDENNSESNIQQLAENGEQLIVEPIPLPWVPEIDGQIKVYIYRNFLHVDADLLYRHPGKEEVDIFSLGSQLQPLAALETVIEDSVSDNTIVAPSVSNNTIADITYENDFTWQYDGDFLNQETEKTFVEKLFNYPLKQTRRMRSTELHYFDHPLIGMLVIIRPYDINEDPPSETDPDPEESLGLE